jgi:hypothetical protein
MRIAVFGLGYPRNIIDAAGELSWSEEESVRSLPGEFS